MEPKQTQDKYEKITELAKRRGFFWPSYEIYGGVAGFVTFGPLGTILKRRIEDKFRDFFIRRFGMQEIESSIITPGKVFEASGHLAHFKEPLVECLKCHKRFRADHLLQEQAKMSDTETEKLSLKELETTLKEKDIHCPECHSKNFDTPKQFLTMFTTTIGPYSEATGYGRPEAAQGIFVEFKRLYEYAREKMPFGVAQIGHALRNEISPRQGLIRLREFTIMDVEYFFDPEEPCPWIKQIENETIHIIPAELKKKNIKKPIKTTIKKAMEKGYVKTPWQAFFMAQAKLFLTQLGVPPDKQRFIEKLEWEKAHYSLQSFDQEIYLDRWGWTEVSGLAYRTDYDLSRHMESSGVDMRVYKEYEKPITKERTVIKPVMAKLGPAFKKDAAKIVQLLQKINPKDAETALEKQGFIMLESFKILPDHVKISKEKIEEKGKHFIPHVVEPSFGSDRLTYITLEYAYQQKEDRTVLKLPREIAPIQIGVFPLLNRDELLKKAQKIHKKLFDAGFSVEYDDSGSVGRRYARMDEIGTPLCITIDHQTLKDKTVTIRDRDTRKQVRTSTKRLISTLHDYFHNNKRFEELGTPVK
ncbi:MAG: glycine--tRNA ligase [Candidatus Bathyarchaeia archaeon]|jgi:glycyl-tRNA synthetase|nr:glycine--tRNA ligase [Candidatus Bathyarchaeota archaeon A05DMB-4]MDH7595071.1 glycine--tRNA ligase [Candidatus Bathyarchaeota archaeon]